MADSIRSYPNVTWDFRLRCGQIWNEHFKMKNNIEKPMELPSSELPQSSSSSPPSEYGAHNIMHPLHGWRLVVVLFTLLFGLFLSVIETSITATALVSIGVHFQDSYTTNWVVLSYLLSYMGFSVIYARLSDAIGHKVAILISWILFISFSLASGLSTSLTQLIVFRSFQGIGGSGLYSMAMTVAPQVTPARLWGTLSACLGATLACSSLLGSILGGLITEKFGWRWIYLFNAPFGPFIGTLFLLAWPKASAEKAQPRTLRLTQIDILGAFLLLMSPAMLVYVLDEAGGSRRPWNSATIIICLTISCSCFIAFILWGLYIESVRCQLNIKPIFSLRQNISRPLGPAILMAFLAGFPFFIVIINLPVRFQLLNGDTPIMSGAHLIPLLFFTAVGSALGGALSAKVNRTFYTLLLASILMCVATGLLSHLKVSQTIARIQYFYQALLGLAVGLSLSSITVMISLSCALDEFASINGAVNQARVFGGSIGLSIANIILNNKITSDLKNVLTHNELQHTKSSLSSIIHLTPFKQKAIIQVFAHAFNDQMRLCLYLSLLGILVTLLAWEKNPASVEERKKLQESLSNG